MVAPINRSPDQVITAPRDKIAGLEHWINTARDGLVEDHWKAIAESIAKDGLQQHPRAWWNEELELWIPVFGHHRFAAMLFGLKWDAIPFIPTGGRPTEAQIRELQWIENNSQLSMKSMEKARAALGIRDSYGETSSAVATRLKVQSSCISDWEGWVTILTKEQQDALDAGEISESVASWLARCADESVRTELFEQARRKKVNRDQVKAAVQKSNGGARKYTRPDGSKPQPIEIRGETASFNILPGTSPEELYTLAGRIFRAAEAAKKGQDITLFGAKLA